MTATWKSYTAYVLGLRTESLPWSELIDLILVAAWAMIAYRAYFKGDLFLFGFAMLACGTRLGMGVRR